ncbi:hypothetical protein CRG98_025762 [Punica granatum]|uniref:Uncharacterized protein n=1 Tax=Punica granatum TaxID=22663 RepID=A0A2I0JCA9_PUNGR|nr:hypothetical protein CRG98_025762 [Punica granatum]
MPPSAFSHCLSATGGGTLAFGVVVEPEMMYTPLIPSKTGRSFEKWLKVGQFFKRNGRRSIPYIWSYSHVLCVSLSD